MHDTRTLHHPSPPLVPPSRRWGWLGAALLVIAVSLAYSNSLRGEFIFDDVGAISENVSIRKLWPIWNVLSAPQELGSTTQGRPLFVLSLAANYAISELDVESYHIFNTAVHLLAAMVLFGLARRTLRAQVFSPCITSAADGLALAIAMVWALHPLATAAVTYMVQRTESMMSLFYLLTLYCLARGAESRRAWPWYAACVAACAAGMATKEAMVSAPLAAILYDRVFLAGSFRRSLSQRWGLYTGLACTWALLAVLVIWEGNRGGTAAAASPLVYAATELGVITHYLRLAFWPHPLCLDYEWPLARSFSEIAAGAAVVGALLAMTVWALFRRPAWGFAGAVFFMVLVPASSFIPLADAAFEHRMYLPLAAIVATTLVGAYGLAVRWFEGRAITTAMAAGVVLLAAVLGNLTYERNSDYRTGITIWRTVLRLHPDNERAHRCLGDHLATVGQFDEALREYDIAASLRPCDFDLFWVRGNLLRQMGRFDEASRDYSRVIELRPADAAAFLARGGCYYRTGKYDEAWSDMLSCRRLGAEPPEENLRTLRAVSSAPTQWK